MRPFTQQDYSEVIKALDKIHEVFVETTDTPQQAAAAMKGFVEGHYLKVWQRQ